MLCTANATAVLIATLAVEIKMIFLPRVIVCLYFLSAPFSEVFRLGKGYGR
jgi:hypothetical protein